MDAPLGIGSEIILRFLAMHWSMEWVYICRCSAINDYLGENVWFVMHNGKNNDAIYLYDLYNFIELF